MLYFTYATNYCLNNIFYYHITFVKFSGTNFYFSHHLSLFYVLGLINVLYNLFFTLVKWLRFIHKLYFRDFRVTNSHYINSD